MTPWLETRKKFNVRKANRNFAEWVMPGMGGLMLHAKKCLFRKHLRWRLLINWHFILFEMEKIFCASVHCSLTVKYGLFVCLLPLLAEPLIYSNWLYCALLPSGPFFLFYFSSSDWRHKAQAFLQYVVHIYQQFSFTTFMQFEAFVRKFNCKHVVKGRKDKMWCNFRWNNSIFVIHNFSNFFF